MPYRAIESLQDFNDVVTLGQTPESLHLEFKAMIRWQKSDGEKIDHKEICRDIAQFANTEGGCLLVGVARKGELAGSIKGIENPDGLRGHIEKVIQGLLVPNTFPKSIVPIQHPDGTILAVNVPPSLHLVALYDRHKQKDSGIEYLYRDSQGKRWMNPDDVERHLMDGSRATKIAVEEVFEGRRKNRLELLPRAIGWFIDTRELDFVTKPLPEEDTAPVLHDLSKNEISIRFKGGSTLNVPYAYVDAVWITADGNPALGLSAQIARGHDGTYYLEPL